MIEGIIFDMDGVMVLTEPVYHKAYQETLNHFNIDHEYMYEMHKMNKGMATSELFFKLREQWGFTISFDDFLVEYRRRYNEIFEKEGLPAVEGVRDLVEKIKKEGFKIIIGTGGSTEGTLSRLKISGLDDLFDLMVSSTDVAQGKPHPETFLLAAQKLGVDPHNCVVIGDAINDVLAAKSAGMKVIAITDTSYIEDPELASPDLEVKEFKDITIDMIRSL